VKVGFFYSLLAQ